MGLSNKRPRRLNYSVNKKGAKSGAKVRNTLKHYETLKKRIGFEGETLWLKNAMVFVKAKMKKYSLNAD